MAKEYLWQGKYRTFSNVDPALYYPNGINPGVSSGYGFSQECFRFDFPLSPSTYYYSGTDFPRITPTRKYSEQEDISNDPVWGLYLVYNTNPSSGCSGASFSDPGFLMITGDFSPDMILNLDTGKFIGRTGEMDQYVSSLKLPPDYKVDEQNYATVGSASYFRNGVGFDIPIRFTARVFSKSNPSIFIDKSFEYGLRNDWSSDRDSLILNLKNQFYVKGVTSTNLQYLLSEKEKGYFPGPPSGTPVTIAETSGLASAPQFTSAPTPNSIWTGTWYAPVSAGSNTINVENYSSDDFTKYNYVKPLIWLTAPNSSQSYVDDSATSYFANAASPGSYQNRLNAIINGLNNLPSGMRVLAPWYYWNGYVYWVSDTEKRSDFNTFITANPDYNTYNGSNVNFYVDGSGKGAKGVFLFNRKSDNIKGTDWSIASIWGATAVSQISQDWNVMCAGLSARGANIDYITFDTEGFPGNAFDGYPVGASFATALTTMQNDPRANTEWYGARSLNKVLTQDGKYSTNSANLAATNRHPQLSPSYIYWNGGLASIKNASLNACFWGTAKQYYPSIGLSNYESFKTNDQDWAYDPNGHPIFQENNVGDGASPYLYAAWNFNSTYSIDPTDNTKIVRHDTNPNTSGASYFTNSIWNCFLLDVQTVRAVRRANPSVKLRPWIRPRSWAGDSAFSVGITAGQGNSPSSGERFYYEIIRHAAVLGAEHFYYWNTNDATTGFLARNSTEVNDIMTEVNTMLGGFSPEVVTTSRISFNSDYVISGTKAGGGKNWNKYVWRVTPKPGIALYDNTGNPLTIDSDGGAWITTGTSNVPQYFTTPIYSGDWAVKTFKNQFYAVCFPGDSSNTIDSTQGITWANWSTDFISYFQGNPISGQGLRAFPWEDNPSNPSISSPWHNAIYESIITWYTWGARSFHFSFPYGSYVQSAGDNVINSNGDAGTFFLSYQIWKDNYKLVLGPKNTSPARWKGFPEAINALIEGRMIPVDVNMNPQVNKTQILEPCNVFLYVPTNMGYYDYRRKASKYWRSLSGTNAQKDATYYSKLDGMIDTFKRMKSTIANGGKLSIGMDVGSNIATPDSITLYRSIRDTTSTSGTDRDASYLSDALELSDWYVLNKLKEAGIDVYLESRYPKTRNRITYEISGIAGSTGATTSSGLLYNNFVSTEQYLWTSNQFTKTALPARVAISGAKDDFVSNSEVVKIHRLNWQSSYMYDGQYDDPYRAWHITTIGATSHDMWKMTVGEIDYTHYTPHAATFYLYALVDHYRQYKNLLQSTNPTKVGVKLNNYNSIAFDPTWFAFTQKPVQDTSNPNWTTYRTDLYTANPKTRVEGGNQGSFPPWNGLTFNAAKWSAGPTAYLQNSTTGSNYWTLAGRNFWANNVMQDSFDGFIAMLEAVSATAAPVSAVAEGWAGATYPYDYYSKNIITSVHGLV
jgi:hypothetical protein